MNTSRIRPTETWILDLGARPYHAQRPGGPGPEEPDWSRRSAHRAAGGAVPAQVSAVWSRSSAGIPAIS
jgi:hypothetical protein